MFTQIRSRAKIEKIRASLFNNNDLIGFSSLDGEDELMEMSTEEILTVSVVNQSLFDTQGSPGLEDYFNDKSIKGRLWICFSLVKVFLSSFKSAEKLEQKVISQLHVYFPLFLTSSLKEDAGRECQG